MQGESPVYNNIIWTLTEQNVCNSDGVPRAPADGGISTASIWVHLGQWPAVSLLPPSPHRDSKCLPLCWAGVCWAFLQSPGLRRAGWFLCVVFVVWVVCVAKPPFKGSLDPSTLHLEPLHLPCHLLPLPNLHVI